MSVQIFLYHFDDFILIITDPHLVANAASAEDDKTSYTKHINYSYSLNNNSLFTRT